jgi:type I restriction-modification system DNA methylase subunit
MAKANAGTESVRPFEAALWAAADKLRGTLDAAEYKHVVLGLIFLKYISDAFEKRREELDRLSRDPDSDLCVKDETQRERLLEDKDEYAAVNCSAPQKLDHLAPFRMVLRACAAGCVSHWCSNSSGVR